jgi:hypothetical protein
MRTALVEGCIVPTENTALEARLETLRAAGHHEEGVSITTGKYLGNTKPDELQRGPPRQGSAAMTLSNGREGPKSIAPHQGLQDFGKVSLEERRIFETLHMCKGRKGCRCLLVLAENAPHNDESQDLESEEYLEDDSCQQIVIEQCIV